MSLSSYPLLSRVVAAAVNVSQKSATILRDIKRSGQLNVQEKEANDYVTRADFLSQLNIVKSLEHLFPKMNLLGEEGELKDEYNDLETSLNEEVLKQSSKIPALYDQLKEEDLIVWVDPLDGTREYTQGHDVAHEVTVLIGVSWQGRPIAGVVNQPFFRQNADNTYFSRVLWGIVGLGAFDLQQGPVSIPPRADPNLTRIVTTRSHLTEIVKRDLQSVPNSSLVHAGGAGYKFLTIIDGKSDAYIYPSNGTKRWDTCAPEALIRSLGGTMTDIFGKEYSYTPDELGIPDNVHGLIASASSDSSQFLQYISSELQQSIRDTAEKVKAKKIAQLQQKQ